jgi:dTDP-4-dehydrorhamnose reductase
MKILVVGGSGMLGSALVSVLSNVPDLEVYATYRTPWSGGPPVEVKKWFMYHSGRGLPVSVQLGEGDWVVNAAGSIPQRKGALPTDTVRVNALLPYELAENCGQTGARMIHVTTDCVFSGKTQPGKTTLNSYKEGDAHDAHELYGRTKSMGEVLDDRRVLSLRCSIVGPEPRGRSDSLLGWFLANAGKPVMGYADHYWSGVTTLALSKVILAVIQNAGELADLPSVHHLVPGDWVNKAQLLGMFSQAFDVPADIRAENVGGIDRTLGTAHPKLNNRLWALAGYEKPPTIEEMVSELACWVGAGNYPFKKGGAK